MVYFHVNLLPGKQHITVVEIIHLLPYSLKISAKFMKLRSCWLIFTLIGLSLTSCSQPKSSQEIAETVKNSIVLISYQNESGHGTGFIVPGKTGVCTILTARHVVEGRSLNLQTDDQKLHKTDSIQTSPNLDLAVVTFQSGGETCPYPSLNLGDSDSVKQTDQIYISGFPDRAGGGKLVRQFVRGSVSGLDVLEQGYGISYDASTFGGMSGGPVLDTSGKVVAVHGKTDAQIVADLQSQQASLSPQQQAALQQAAARVAGGGVQFTFKWGIPIKNYLDNFNTIHPSFNTRDIRRGENVCKDLKLIPRWILRKFGCRLVSGVQLFLCGVLITWGGYYGGSTEYSDLFLGFISYQVMGFMIMFIGVMGVVAGLYEIKETINL